MNRDHEPMVIREYDPAWPEQFAYLAFRVRCVLGKLVREVEHIGSTAVPGLPAKPIIDLDVVLASPAGVRTAIRRLHGLGYVHEGDHGIVGREAFRWPPGEMQHHLYLLTADAVELARHLALRDTLRADRVRRDAYAALKRSLAVRYLHDGEAYSAAKSALIAQIVGDLQPARADIP